MTVLVTAVVTPHEKKIQTNNRKTWREGEHVAKTQIWQQSWICNPLVVKLMSSEPRGKNYSSECKERLLSDKKASKRQVRKKTNRKMFQNELGKHTATILACMVISRSR